MCRRWPTFIQASLPGRYGRRGGQGGYAGAVRSCRRPRRSQATGVELVVIDTPPGAPPFLPALHQHQIGTAPNEERESDVTAIIGVSRLAPAGILLPDQTLSDAG